MNVVFCFSCLCVIRTGMQRPLWERRGLKLRQERKKRRHQSKAKMQKRKGKNKFNMFLTQLNVVRYF